MLGGAAGEDGRAESLAARSSRRWRWGAAARRESREEEGAACWWWRPTAAGGPARWSGGELGGQNINQKILSLGQQVSKLTSLIRWPEYQERLSPYRVRAAETKSVLNNQIQTEHTQYLSVQRRPI